MFASKLILPAVWLLFLGTASAAPARVEQPAAATIAGAPRDATATIEATSTGAAQSAAPKKKGGTVECRNMDGEFKPFCLPKNNDVYYPGSTHYVTWDPSFITGDNTTVKIVGFYTPNTTTTTTHHRQHPKTPNPDDDEDADDDDNNNDAAATTPAEPEEVEVFSSDPIDSAWGFYQWRLEKSILSSQKVRAANITVRMVALGKNSDRAQWHEGPTILLTHKPKKPSKHAHQAPDTDALVVVLPLFLTLAVVMVIASSVWNRRTRAIDLGDLVRAASRRKSKTRNKRGASKAKAEEGIRLMDRDGCSSGEEDGSGGWKRRVD
ncbi:hypothetical protein BT67DRAFT_87581 [Trichocladium antarcticum]|uniref:Uncharacterized protein n=1 Tax=Trichocladium antarcticum TaxID=1450529 RepID=A0AAN6UGV2_9PEZI|nr:hypothetical protein BT67DRAFT_87581 [Trichocladium antarcticum]